MNTLDGATADATDGPFSEYSAVNRMLMRSRSSCVHDDWNSAFNLLFYTTNIRILDDHIAFQIQEVSI